MATVQEMTAQVIEKSMKDPEFRQQLLANPKTTIERETGIAYPADVKIKVIEEDPDVMVLTIPKVPAASGEVSDAQLESVTGGFRIGSTMICSPGTGCVICFLNNL